MLNMTNYGWIPEAERTEQQNKAHELARMEMSKFLILGTTDESDEKVDLTELWKAPQVVKSIGYNYPGTRQEQGSCVGVGGGNCIFTLSVIEVAVLKESEEIIVPFWLLPYARSRYYCGMTSKGDGSLGSTFAKAAKEDGVIPATRADLPKFVNSDGLCWGARVEIDWSDGDSKQIMDLLPDGRKHLVKSTAECNTPDDVEQAIRNGYPCTTASSLIPNPRVEADGEAYGRVSNSGGHQTCYMGVWRHPTKGKRYFLYVNQWGLGWGKEGKCWVPEEDVAAAIRNGRETYAFSQFNGFPAKRIPLEKFKIL